MSTSFYITAMHIIGDYLRETQQLLAVVISKEEASPLWTSLTCTNHMLRDTGSSTTAYKHGHAFR